MPLPKLDGIGVLITGGAGFIGSHLADALVERGARVRVLDNLSTGLQENLAHLASDIEWIADDLRDVDACQRACDGVELVFHQAALGSVPRSLKDPASSLAVNVSGTANLFTAARDAGCRRLVYASSSSVYGDSAELPKRVGVEGEPLSPYALSKKMNEDLARVFQRCYDMELVGLRYFNIFGPRQRHDGPYAAVIPRFFAAYDEGQAPVIYGDGEQSRDFTFVADAVQANLLAAGAPSVSARGAYNVASGRRATVNELAELIRRLCGGGPEPIHEPQRSGDVRHSLADLTATTEGLDYQPGFDIESGLAKLAESRR